MSKYIKLSFIILLLIFSYISCDSESQKQVVEALVGPDGGTVTSADGKLTIEIPPGALSEDTRIGITRINSSDLPPEFEGLDPDLAYLLEPDGLEFNVPVTASLALDDQPVQEDGSLSAALVLLITSSEGMLEVLENLTVEVDGDANTTTVSGELSHFSPLVDEIGGITGTVEGVPDSLEPGSTFLVDVTITRPPLDRFRLIGPPETPGVYADKSLFPITSEFGTEFALSFTTNNNEQVVMPQKSIQYLCDVAGGVGLYRSSIRIFLIEPTGILPKVFFRFLSFKKVVSCTTDPVPTPSPMTPPQPTPTPTPSPTGCAGVAGQHTNSCSTQQDPFLVFPGNFGGSNFALAYNIALSPDAVPNTVITINQESNVITVTTTPPDIFEATGTVTESQDGSCVVEAEGRGMLGDPVGANLIVKLENWVFIPDGNGDFVLDSGTLRLNFPTFPSNSQSAIAECMNN